MCHQETVHRWRLRLAAASLTLVWAGVPLHAHADIGLTVTGMTSAVCQLTSLTIQTTYPISPSATAPLNGPTAPNPYSVGGQGTCTTVFGTTTTTNVPMTISGGGATLGTPTCTEFAGSGMGVVTVGAGQWSGILAIAGPTSSSDWGLVLTPTLSAAGAATGDMSMDPTSLDACMQNGTSTLDYTGTVVLAL